MFGTLRWVITVVVVICEGRHKDADQMLSNERNTLDDCRLRFHELESSAAGAPSANGRPALLKEFAHMGAIGWTQDNGKVLWHCGGTLIWIDYVLTAAHCVLDHWNIEPDIVRFGDLNLETDEYDEYAQQYKITQIYRHPLHRFSLKYHDIALMKLEQPIRLHDAVCPACLWVDPHIRFTEFIATGWGSTGHFENRSPSLMKVSLKPMESSKCEKFYSSELVRGLKSGLHENHLCAVDAKMDTCEGDSGGPLQVKLLHSTRLTPFVVAVTSFGLPCGLANPGVYTKIAPYKDWILATMRQDGAVIEDDIFNATFCALRYQQFRDHINTRPYNKTHVIVKDFLTNIYKDNPPTYLVQLMWNTEGSPQNCYGTIIDENTVLTVANCVHYQGIPASTVSHPREGVINISKINVHPQYNPAYGYSNIAILRLEKLFSFINIRPACIDYVNVSIDQPNAVFGFGRRDIYVCNDFPDCIDPSLIPLVVHIEPKNETTCRLSRELQSRFPDGITDELICAGIDRFMVPESCDLKLGGSYSYVSKKEMRWLPAIDRTIDVYGDLYPPLDGLVQIGRDCGYGEHLLSTRLRSHLKWLERVLLPKRATANAVQFLDHSRREWDLCTDTHGLRGRCTLLSRCQRKWKKFELTKEATFCSSTSMICCPNDDIDKAAQSSEHLLLMKCPKLVNVLQPKNNGAPMVRIFDNSTKYICMGAIISDRTILTSASCVSTAASLSVQPLGNSEISIQVRQTVQHSSFNATDYSNDIAILRLPQSLIWSPQLHPVCLWNNQTHSPLIVEMLQSFSTTDVTDIEYIENNQTHSPLIAEMLQPFSTTDVTDTEYVEDTEDTEYIEDTEDTEYIEDTEDTEYIEDIEYNQTHYPLIAEMLQPFNTTDVTDIEDTEVIDDLHRRYIEYIEFSEQIKDFWDIEYMEYIEDVKYMELLTMYNSDCQRTHAYRVRDSHICVKYPYREYTCLPSHSMLRWKDAGGVPYLIGLSTDTRDCMRWSYMIFSRVAAFIDWIVDNIDDEEIKRSFSV
ncbi:uncharacterized protein LOC115256693 [Aedes albopictus]|uniref:Peptidase S1 domain-containing protein n=1 Tax=Aedes albopictus TaxID=7160 RepID=A0ABM1YXK3_AEDAL